MNGRTGPGEVEFTGGLVAGNAAGCGFEASWYDRDMTTVEILYSYRTPPTEQAALALAGAKDVYGIRRLQFDRVARTLRIEYDATRLTAAAVTKLVLQAGLDIDAELALIAPPAPEPAPAA